MKKVKILSWSNICLGGKKSNFMVSSNGKIINSNTGKILKLRIDKNGYVTVRVTFKKKKYTIYVHREVAKAFVPNPENKPQVNHKNGRKYDNRSSNLEWSTNSENQLHAYKHGLNTSGDKHYSDEVIIRICELLEEGHGRKDIIFQLGFPDKRKYNDLVRRVNNREIRKHIVKNYNF